MVRLMHRPDPFDRKDPRGGEADIILGKHRSGPTAEFCHWRTVVVPPRGHLQDCSLRNGADLDICNED
jgi:hypothetical protein